MDFDETYDNWAKMQFFPPPAYVKKVCRIWHEENAFIGGIEDYMNKVFWNGRQLEMHEEEIER